MGRSNSLLIPFYRECIKPAAPVGLLGFQEESIFPGKCYDLALGNWDINSDWSLDRNYNSIISLRCPYFAKDPIKFIEKVYDHLDPGGTAYLDWGLGDHWRFDEYKVGWKKGEEHEYAYKDDNYLWSCVWNDTFMDVPSVKDYAKAIQEFGYTDLPTAIREEVPSLLLLEDNTLESWIDKKIHFRYIPYPRPQLYLLLELTK